MIVEEEGEQVESLEKDKMDASALKQSQHPPRTSHEVLTRREKITETSVIMTINMALPTVDVYSDLYFIAKLIIHNQLKWAGLLLAPFLLNYLICWNVWRRLDQRKTISWIPALLGCYPQYSAARVIRTLWRTPARGMRDKRRLDREVSELEVFGEAVFTVLVMTFFMMRGLLSGDYREGKEGALIFGEGYWIVNDTLFTSRDDIPSEFLDEATHSPSTDYYLFFLTYSTSIMTASLGLAKTLLVGPCRVLPEGGALGGLCGGKFLLLMCAMGCTLVSKGLALAGVFEDDNPIYQMLSLTSMFGPGLLLSVLSLCHYRLAPRDVLSHPSLLLLPVFTYFTFRASGCCTSHPGGRLAFSRTWTLANLGLSLAGLVVFASLVYVRHGCLFCPSGSYLVDYQHCLPVPVGALFLTPLFLFLDSCHPCCCHQQPLQKSVLVPKDPLVEYVVTREEGLEEVITMEQWMARREGR